MDPSNSKSITAVIVQIAQLLRKQVHAVSKKKRTVNVLGPSNKIEQIAKLLREEIHKTNRPKTN